MYGRVFFSHCCGTVYKNKGIKQSVQAVHKLRMRPGCSAAELLWRQLMNMVMHVASRRRSESLTRSAAYRVSRKRKLLFSPLNISTLHPVSFNYSKDPVELNLKHHQNKLLNTFLYCKFVLNLTDGCALGSQLIIKIMRLLRELGLYNFLK